ncbi:TATA box-binding protein-associated factor RNA polymerase I subunit B-like [Acanthaster planci]|uniref:TATA box-binding protein-associated factor RNA polymerase I subunit B-like n=1 Tax=Acanthaster planci TaxID=133434 RepID=A0A8B7YM63_ACAPL|nr:TATA box-binding protein-associated factor RNA polymerase I subunit B-like [Acanthaster planci]
MPTCGNCRQEVDFYEHGGLFYCNECDTQSQVMRVIEKDDDFTDLHGLSHAHMYSTKKSKKMVTKDETDAEEQQEQSWWSAELYQAILKAQVKALLAMGFPSKLDEIVMQLWFRYLSKSGTAFCKTPKAANVSEDVQGEIDKEDQEEDTSKRPPWKKGKRNRKLLCKDDWLHRSEKGTIVTNAIQRSHTDKIRLSLWNSVCFMYMGLQALKEHVLLSDLLRWVREGHLPLRSTADVIPEHISKTLSIKDIGRFCNPLVFMPDVNYVFSLLKELSAKLDVTPQSLSSTEMSFIIFRVIHTLNLPNELCQCVHRLHLQVPLFTLETALSKGSPASPECLALTYVVVTLKLLFRLDDCNEHLLSSRTQKLQPLFPDDIHLFNWDVWLEVQKLRVQQKLSQEGFIQNPSDIEKVRNMAGFVQHFNNFYQVEQVNKHLHAVDKTQIRRQEKLKEYQRPFRTLLKESNSSHLSHSAPSSFAVARPTLQSVPSNLPEHTSPKETSDQPQPVTRLATSLNWVLRDDLLSEDFSSHTLSHLTNLKALCEQCIVPPKSVFEALDLPEKSDQSELWSWRKDSAKLHPKKPKSKRLRQQIGKADEEKECGCEKSEADEDEVLTNSCEEDGHGEMHHYLRDMGLVSLNTSYVTYPTCSKSIKKMKPEHQMDCFHKSMAWLLDLCGQLWELRPKDISLCVLKLENILFQK